MSVGRTTRDQLSPLGRKEELALLGRRGCSSWPSRPASSGSNRGVGLGGWCLGKGELKVPLRDGAQHLTERWLGRRWLQPVYLQGHLRERAALGSWTSPLRRAGLWSLENIHRVGRCRMLLADMLSQQVARSFKVSLPLSSSTSH